jgi:uncharacterized membrane protein YhaH (DUF805 family)
MRLADLLLKPAGKVGRLQFVAAGVLLAAIKLALDYCITTFVFRGVWSPFEYLWSKSPVVALSDRGARPHYFTLLLVAAPFAWMGVCLCAKRLRSAGAPVWLTLFFFVPIAKWFLFVILISLPENVSATGTAPADARREHDVPADTWRRRLGRTKLRSALTASVVTTLVGLLLTWLSVSVFRAYGSTLFLATPFVLGLITSVVHGAAQPRTLAESIVATLLALVLIGASLVAVAAEGIVCIAMAAPLATVEAILGCMIGHAFVTSRARRGPRIGIPALALMPLLLIAEQQRPGGTEIHSVTTRVVINADRETVWNDVVAFSEIPPPRELIFRAGIAYPLRARIDGAGVGATRHCVFSTGAFVEPITTWDAPTLLAFDVSAQPDPLTELSPYGRIDAPHLHGYFSSQRGEFRLTELPGGRTLLAGTTWYVNRIEPSGYWRLWSDYLIHAIHRRVLEHIKADAEG